MNYIMKWNIEKIFLVIILLCSSLLFFKTPGTADVDSWLQWAHSTNNLGIIKGYEETKTAYPPFSILILWISTKISTFFGLSEFIGIKLSMYFFLLLTLIIIYKATRNYFLTVIAYLFLMINSLGLIYTDIHFTPFLILSLFYLKKRNILLTSIFYCLASLIKPQVIIIMPFVVLQIFNMHSLSELKHFDYKKITLNFILPFILIYSAILLMYGEPFIRAFQTSYGSNATNIISGEAANLGWIITFFLHIFFPGRFGSLGSTNFTIRMIMGENILLYILQYIFIASYIFIFIKYFKQKEKSFKKFLLYTAAAYLTYFIINKGVHENHLHVAVILFLMLYGEDKKYFFDMLMWGILFNINMIVIYGFDGMGFNRYDPRGLQNPFTSYRVITYLDLSLLFSFISVAIYFIFISKYIFSKNGQLSQTEILP